MNGFGNQNKSKDKLVNTTNIFKKEDVLKKAINFHSQGKIEEALESYKHLIKKGFHHPLVYLNYGSILKYKGNPDKVRPKGEFFGTY